MKKQVVKNFEIIWAINKKFFASLFGLFLLAAAAAIGVAIAYKILQSDIKELEALNQTIDEKNQTLFQLEQKLNFIRVELEVNNMSLQKLQAELKRVQQDNTQLKEKLTFYQSVMAPELAADGVIVDELLIEPTLIENQYRYKVILVQTSKQKRFAKGYISLSLHGIQNDKNLSIDFKQLAVDDNDTSFSFRYFQILEGNFVLPERFTPERVNLAVVLPRRSGQSYSRTDLDYDWSPQVVHRE
ncbi:DUF6776 family protein [Catenovulum agarivorans]|uniref:DUF6776 family protein n=1 Tax=Catenovulum agarivorans TaxID=1172192 RepID=UPI0002F11774|nr:DUF6776 family protein [Catenovulum agarivorans]